MRRVTVVTIAAALVAGLTILSAVALLWQQGGFTAVALQTPLAQAAPTQEHSRTWWQYLLGRGPPEEVEEVYQGTNITVIMTVCGNGSVTGASLVNIKSLMMFAISPKYTYHLHISVDRTGTNPTPHW